MERKLIPFVVLMMALAGLFAFDNYYAAAGVTGAVVHAGAYSCSDTDNGDPYGQGITSSELYEDGFTQDRCVGDDLLEFYCTDDGPDVAIINCPRGCSEGACN